MSAHHAISCPYPEGCNCSVREWYRGYACAVAQIINTHCDEQVARDVLLAGGRDLMRFADPEDQEVINQHCLTER